MHEIIDLTICHCEMNDLVYEIEKLGLDGIYIVSDLINL